MTDTELLTILKEDLQRPPATDEYLTFLINSAKEQIAEKGITLSASSVEDNHLVIMYASWLYRKRNSNEGMPRMIQYALHSRLVAEKGEVSEDASE